MLCRGSVGLEAKIFSKKMLHCNTEWFILHCNKFIHPQPEELAMYKDLFAPLLQNTTALPAPMLKANKLVVAEVERLVNFQMGALRYYVDIALNQLKAVAEISDVSGLQEFVKGQVEVANKVRQRVMDDTKALTELSTDFKADLDTLAKESAEDLSIKKAA
jgi:phasin family protein